MNITAPRTASEGLAQALRLERAEQIIRDGYSFFPDEDADLDLVAVCKPGSLAAVYWITQRGTVCDCKDFEETKKPCKHLIAYKMVVEQGIETIASSDVETVKEFCRKRDERREIEAGMEANQLETLRQMDEDYANCEGIYPYA